ncbi:nucleotidyltransferase family protein [Erythrobacter sp. F6033]|nr:nucleotidyltransferase family protein [Erythrobacter sp. F6033]
MQGFAHAQLREVVSVPQWLKDLWIQEARRRVMMNVNQARDAVRLHGVLEDEGIANIVLKGLPLAERIYGSLAITVSGDIDFLVQPSNAARALRLLEKQGYCACLTAKPLTQMQAATVIRHHKEITLRHDDGGIIDLHWRLVDAPQILAGIKPFENARKVTIKKLGHCKILGEADEFAYLCAHGALSDWNHLKWLCDIHRLLKTYQPDGLRALVAHADSLAAGPCAMQALAMREVIFAEPIPKAIASMADKLPNAENLHFFLDRVEQIGTPPSLRDRVTQIWRQAKARRDLYARPTEAIFNLRSHLFALPDILALPLPSSLDFLYLPLRPFLWLKRRFSPNTQAP